MRISLVTLQSSPIQSYLHVVNRHSDVLRLVSLLQLVLALRIEQANVRQQFATMVLRQFSVERVESNVDRSTVSLELAV